MTFAPLLARHRSEMTMLFVGLVIAGVFALLPGRIMHTATFSPPSATIP